MELQEKYNKNYKILQLDGGGILGVIFLKFLTDFEEKMGKKCYEIFDIIIGTSTGGIAGALLASGMSASDVLNLYTTNGKKIFDKRFLGFLNPTSWFSGQYDRKYIDGLCDKYLSMRMSELKTNFIVTSVNMNERNKTHFMKSYKENYRNKLVAEMVKRTYSAPTYFGYYKDNDGIWADGGVGVQNCTLMESCCEIERLGKKDSHFILSCGCGYSKDTDKSNSFIGDQVGDFIPIAREQAIISQLNYASELGFNFARADIEIDKKINKLDGVKYINNYLDIGKKLTQQMEYLFAVDKI